MSVGYQFTGARNTIIFCIVLCGIAMSGGAANAPVVTVTPSRITVTGISPGGEVLFFGAGAQPNGRRAILHHWSNVVQDAAHDGQVTLDLDPPVTWNAVWVIADLRNGHYTIVSTPGYPVLHPRLTRSDFKRDPSGAISRFLFGRFSADFAYVTPGGKAWRLLVHDGGGADADSTTDGVTTFDLARAVPLTDAADRPHAFTPGGTLFIIDPTTLDVLDLKLDGSILGGAQ